MVIVYVWYFFHCTSIVISSEDGKLTDTLARREKMLHSIWLNFVDVDFLVPLIKYQYILTVLFDWPTPFCLSLFVSAVLSP